MRLHVFYQQPPETLWNKSDRWRWGHVIKHPIKNHIFFLERNVKVCRFKLFLLKITSRTTSKTCEANDIRPGSLDPARWGQRSPVFCSHFRRGLCNILTLMYRLKNQEPNRSDAHLNIQEAAPVLHVSTGTSAAPGVAEVRQLWGRRGSLYHFTCSLDSSVDHLSLSRT